MSRSRAAACAALLAASACRSGPAPVATATSAPVGIATRVPLVDVTIGFVFSSDVPKTMKVYEPAAERPITLWETGKGAKLSDLPISGEIRGGKLAIAPGTAKSFVLVLENTGDKPLRFFAAPHVVSPPELALGVKFKCLCVNQVYEVPAKQFWYRVVKLIVAEDYVGSAIEIVHTLVGVSDGRSVTAPSSGDQE